MTERTQPGRALAFALILTLGYSVVEAFAGWWAGSLALLSDAGHMLSDGASLGIATFAAWAARRAPSARHSYGFGRAEIMAGFVNAAFMLGILVWIAVAAVQRLLAPQAVRGEAVAAVALVGLLINVGVALVLARAEKNMNTRAALLHVMGDLTPLHLSLDEIGRSIAAIEGVRSVHDLHVWTLSSDRIALSGHLVSTAPGRSAVQLRNLIGGRHGRRGDSSGIGLSGFA